MAINEPPYEYLLDGFLIDGKNYSEEIGPLTRWAVAASLSLIDEVEDMDESTLSVLAFRLVYVLNLLGILGEMFVTTKDQCLYLNPISFILGVPRDR